MSTQVTREQLIKKKEQLLKSLDEVQTSLNKFDEIVYGGKLKKSIELLKEVLDYLIYPTIDVVCEDCGVEFDLDLDYVIVELERLYGREFKK